MNLTHRTEGDLTFKILVLTRVLKKNRLGAQYKLLHLLSHSLSAGSVLSLLFPDTVSNALSGKPSVSLYKPLLALCDALR